MTQHTTRLAVALTGVLATVVTTALPFQLAFGEGGARRDVERQEEQNVRDAINHATEAVGHGKQGNSEKFVTHAEASLQQAMRGKDQHLDEAITNLKEAVEHGKAGRADVATKHVESALTHLSSQVTDEPAIAPAGFRNEQESMTLPVSAWGYVTLTYRHACSNALCLDHMACAAGMVASKSPTVPV